MTSTEQSPIFTGATKWEATQVKGSRVNTFKWPTKYQLGNVTSVGMFFLTSAFTRVGTDAPGRFAGIDHFPDNRNGIVADFNGLLFQTEINPVSEGEITEEDRLTLDEFFDAYGQDTINTVVASTVSGGGVQQLLEHVDRRADGNRYAECHDTTFAQKLIEDIILGHDNGVDLMTNKNIVWYKQPFSRHGVTGWTHAIMVMIDGATYWFFSNPDVPNVSNNGTVFKQAPNTSYTIRGKRVNPSEAMRDYDDLAQRMYGANFDQCKKDYQNRRLQGEKILVPRPVESEQQFTMPVEVPSFSGINPSAVVVGGAGFLILLALAVKLKNG